MQVKWVPSPNFNQGRKGKKIIAIVNHITAGSYPGCLNWLCNPKAQASAHYLVTKSGEIYQLVKDEDTAWHAGRAVKPAWRLYDGTNPNLVTIGIEHEGQPRDTMPDAQYQATLWLHRELVRRYGIPVDRDHIIGHCVIDTVSRANCPGPGFPWQRLFADLQTGSGPGESTVKIRVAGRELDGVLIGDRSFAPVRALAEALGKKVTWDAQNRVVVIE